MPNLKSAYKRIKQDEKRNLSNRIRKTRAHNTERVFDEAIAAGDKDGAAKALEACFSTLDRAAQAGSIHKNRADRKKSRLYARLQALMS